ncbi:MAG: penicillin acylase family protein, partial [Terriglobales bacterium]
MAQQTRHRVGHHGTVSRIVFALFVIILLLVPTGLGVGWFVAQRSLPVLDGVVTVSDLARSAVVKYDERGVPYIEASSDRDAFLVQGFATAADRMFQMDMARRSALGQLAEVFGQDSLSHDKLVRTIGFERIAKEQWKSLPADVKSALEAYARGVNQYIDGAKGRMPMEFLFLGFEPHKWRSIDTLA